MPVKDDDPRAPELDAAFAAAMAGEPSGARMTERDLQAAVLAECARLGLRVFCVPNAARSGIGRIAPTAKGWPDLVIGSRNGLLFRELKTEYGETSADQDWWLWILHRGAVDVKIWRPADWQSGEIQAELRALA